MAKIEGIGMLITDIGRLLRRRFQQELEGSGMTLAQAKALLYVSRNEGIRQVDLADLMEVQPITLARLLDQLSAFGWVRREPDPSDRRAYRLSLLPAAQEPLQAINTASAAIRGQLLHGISPSQAQRLFDDLVRMRDTLSSK